MSVHPFERSGPASLKVRAANVGDLSTVVDILSEASLWERAHGIADPWPNPFPAERVAPGLDAGEVFLAFLDERPAVATVNLSWDDLRFWGTQPPIAGYIHRLAVRPSHAGRSIGRSLIEWAARRIEEHARPLVRLDCLAANSRLCRYYTDLGFEPRGVVTVGDLLCAKFERRADEPFPAQP
jgi:ribosomal protein S18 acetylase RimI-like enzyme